MEENGKIYIADKLTVDTILNLLLNGELGLAALRGLISDSAGTAQETSASIDALGEVLGAVKGYLEDNANGLDAIKAAVDGRADAATAAAVKSLLENGTYGLNALKAAITGRANETTATAIKSLLENGTYGLNALKTAITGNVKAIKSVQSGVAVHTKGQSKYNVTISPVVVSKTFVMSQNMLLADSSGNLTTPTTEISVAYLANSTTLQLFASSSAADRRIPWQVVEFY